ncbi:amidohydrolase [Novosphingobium sp.]|uniref:amidohydrolase n=1 Tax=Novosphingobium sp. TaxID=1874826 RepID=UPI0022C60BE5|nr:amidohydrolase [Novosphingobium sp.]MCZ8019089.1 amidohydrolase [Novosphingobium sp.]MCZ8034897.1 amidohydrolase [Novosphingobium sp.]MCZ8052465.1 amidohydrolase [Novosphingobium sp.]MCZ8058564.1 amidohydrolase [Novosphingobium sp.]MCZ8232961.1 amidohydrolase [Novosphingobium sp.]
MRTRSLIAGAAALALLATPGLAKKKDPEPSPAAKAAREFNKDPYPSTYKPYPGEATALVGATVFDGAGGRIDNGTVLFADGKVVAVGGADLAIPANYRRIDGTGKFVTPGIIDIHSHLGDYPSPSVDAHSDGNEATAPTTPDVWAEHSIWPQDPGFSRALANGGITALQILPGSANLVGGRSVTLKNVYARTIQGMKFPGAPYGLKMACGENPKRVYGSKGRMPSTRMGNMAVNRATWIKAKEYKAKRDAGKLESRDLAMESMVGVLEGEILIQNHCYRADEMALVLDMAREFGYKVTAFHHATEAFKIGDLLKASGTCSAIWADWWGFKMESYDGIPENAGILHKTGACVVIHSDDENGIQRLNQEAAKAQGDARRAGIDIPDAEVIRWLTLNPATAMGIDKQTGSLAAGKMADVVLWNGNPLSVYSRPDKVWVDGALLFDAADRKRRPVSDFELGQVGEGDVK